MKTFTLYHIIPMADRYYDKIATRDHQALEPDETLNIEKSPNEVAVEKAEANIKSLNKQKRVVSIVEKLSVFCFVGAGLGLGLYRNLYQVYTGYELKTSTLSYITAARIAIIPAGIIGHYVLNYIDDSLDKKTEENKLKAYKDK